MNHNSYFKLTYDPLENHCKWYTSLPGVTGQNIPPAELYPGLKRNRLDYTRVYYGLGQFIPPQANLYPNYINHDINSVELQCIYS